MTTVYQLPKKNAGTFHRTPDCHELSTAQMEPVGVYIDDLSPRVRPCRICYPDAPHVKVIHRHCAICDHGWPCEHNGGVRIEKIHAPMKRADGTTGNTPYKKTYWVWPEHVHRY